MKKRIITLVAILIGLPLIGILLDACNLFENSNNHYEIRTVCAYFHHVQKSETSWAGDLWNGKDTLRYSDTYLQIRLLDSISECSYLNPFLKNCYAGVSDYLPNGNIENVIITCSKIYNESYTPNTNLNEIFLREKTWGEVESISDFISQKPECESGYGFFINSDYPPNDTITCIFTVCFELTTGRIVNAIFPTITLIP